MAASDLHAEQPMDPRTVMAIEAVFRNVSLTPVQFVAAPRMFRKSNPKGSAAGPKPARKAEIKLQLAERDGFQCAYCAREFVDLDEATLDHVIPNSVVGHWQTWNLVLACAPCNNLKADKVPVVLVPMLFSLLTALTTPAMNIARQAREEKRRAENAIRLNAKKQRRRERMAWERRLRLVKHLESLSGVPARPALEAAPQRLALTAGTGAS